MMFERMMDRAARRAERRAKEAAMELAERVRAELPPGVEAEAIEGGVRLAARGLKRRYALDPALRWLLAGLR